MKNAFRGRIVPLPVLLFLFVAIPIFALFLAPLPARAAPRPDLIVTRLVPSRPAQEPGGMLLLDFTVENLGLGEADNFYVRFYFTKGGAPGPDDAALTDKLVLRLGPGQRLDGKVALRLPPDLADGPGSLVAVADDGGTVTEVNEINNMAEAAFSVGGSPAGGPYAAQPGAPQTAMGTPAPATIPDAAPAPAPKDGQAPEKAPASPEERYYGTTGQTPPDDKPAAQPGGKPDLVVTSASIPEGRYLPGQDMMVDFEIRNNGGSTAEHFFVAFCVLLDGKTADPATCPDRQMVQSLEPNTARGDRGSVLLPFGLVPGRHRLAVIVDFDDKVPETDETNNAATASFTSLPASGGS